MKNIKVLILLICFFSFSCILKADGIENPITFTLIENFYSDIVKRYENDTTVFYYTNNLLNMDLTDEELKTVLSQKSGSGSSRLTYYETLNIQVKPVPSTNFESLKNKSTFFRANGGGSWVSNISHNQDMEQTAVKVNLNNNFWPWGFKLQYRLDINDNFVSTVPSEKDLTNKTLEEQLAEVLNLDLNANPDAIIEQYKLLWRFNPLPNDYTFLIRYDFFDTKNDVLPTLKDESTDEYLTSSLKLLDTKYVAIKYDRTGTLPTGLILEEKNNKNFSLSSLYLPLTLLLAGASLYFFKKKKIFFK